MKIREAISGVGHWIFCELPLLGIAIAIGQIENCKN